ncbi:S8 family serine peptidase [Streptomyces sp. ACA25]|uniref:S8 family serine peptidase n=1 Tax=Streptomyces sp. ACA25 TaxID=3022596 RepID=UPI0023081D45|nr:S8 family serine peptidase [Streptomyces sp. ACA25]MDB1086911.1 S8 family serine peptidase [Streptomyces sp. ACA25]
MAVKRNSRRWRARTAVATASLLALGLGAAVPAVAADDTPTGTIENAGANDTIEGSYVVVLADDGFSASSAESASLAAAYDAEITSVFEHALNGFAIKTSEERALELAADPAVAKVVQNETVELFTETQTNPPSWGLDRIDQVDLPADDSYTYPAHGGEGVTVYIMDTGVHYSHEDFEGRARFGFDAFGGDGSDGQGHGTHVAGTVGGAAHGVAKQADLVSVKVLNDNGSGTIESVVGGIDWATADADGPAVANMSLGGNANAVLDEAVAASVASGITYAVAAGNDYGADAGSSSPARVAEAITVASTDRADLRSGFSNIGTSVQIFAPGSAITSAWHTSDTATNTISGTSMAAPHVAGAAALHLAGSPADSPAEVWQALSASAVHGKVTNPGNGSPNKLLHIGEGDGGEPEPLDPPNGKRFTNDTEVPVLDHQTAESVIAVKGVGKGVIPANLEVDVDITHTWRGDLTIDLIAPDGTEWNLKAASPFDSGDDVRETYTVDATVLDKAKGDWTLRVHDGATRDEGHINSWSLQF